MKDSGKLLLYYSPFPFQPSLNYLSNNCDVASLKVGNLILYMVAFLIDVSSLSFLPKCGMSWKNFMFSYMFFKSVNVLQPQNHILALHKRANHAFHLINFSTFVFQHLHPWHRNNPCFFTIMWNIINFLWLPRWACIFIWNNINLWQVWWGNEGG